MVRATFVAAGLLLTTAIAGHAQDQRVSPQDSTTSGGAGIRSGNITSTGETVPNPGASQGAGTTSLDLGIQKHDNEVDTSICKGC